MRVFVTGATGFIGSILVPELIGAGHEVLGLTRHDAGARALTEAGAQVHRGAIEDLESLRSGAAASDAVIHLAFNHDFSRFLENCENDRRAIEAMGSALAGPNKLLIVTSGTAAARSRSGAPATEDDEPASSGVMPRAASEEAAATLAARGVRVATVRLPQVHDTEKQGLVTYAIQIAREKGVSAYIGEGLNRWPAAHRLDVARLYLLALEKGDANVRYNAVAEEGVAMRDIAEMIGRGLRIPVVSLSTEAAGAHFGWLGAFAALDLVASGRKTQTALGWHPTGPSLLTDLANMRY